VLDERRRSSTGAAPLEPGEHERYFAPAVSAETATLYEHCARALDRSLDVGAHGLPLMGGGDWNDGMNRVGRRARARACGWLVPARHARRFARSPRRAARLERAERWRARSRARAAVEAHAWDGAWYVRAFFDDGTPLGSAARSDECQIDSIAQSWAVISGAARSRARARAMASVDERLVRRDDGSILLFTPPFDHTPHDPGYIKGYPPGIRENGGQYTHAAAWDRLMAFAALGRRRQGRRALRCSTRSATRARPASPLQGRALRRRADVYAAPAARRARRLDLVHRLGGLDVPRRPRVDPRLHGARRHPCIPRASIGSVHPPPSCESRFFQRSSKTPSAPRAIRKRFMAMNMGWPPGVDPSLAARDRVVASSRRGAAVPGRSGAELVSSFPSPRGPRPCISARSRSSRTTATRRAIRTS
jgi:hypothetical protein